jgi:4,5:9,10-diseco-3-hydroxy-5,9,17-trioxoandrosta-1(10),2-diene-4-oate hydrolase
LLARLQDWCEILPRHRRNGKPWRIGALGASLVLLAHVAAALLGTGRQNMAKYRSAVGAQQPSRVVLDGISISYTDSGGFGPVVICLHAIGHGARDFEDLSPRLGPRYRVIALDLPKLRLGFPSRYTQILAKFIDKLHLQSVVLLGNSIGGAVSIRYASRHPERVKAIVLCDSGGLGPPGSVGQIFIGVFVQFFAAGRRGAFWYPWAFARYYRKVLLKPAAQEEHERIIRSAYEIVPTLEEAWRSFNRPEENLAPLLPQIRCPVLLAWAKDDFVVPLKRSTPSFQAFPNQH